MSPSYLVVTSVSSSSLSANLLMMILGRTFVDFGVRFFLFGESLDGALRAVSSRLDAPGGGPNHYQDEFSYLVANAEKKKEMTHLGQSRS